MSLIYVVGYTLCKPSQCEINKPVDIPFDTVTVASKSGAILKGWKLAGPPSSSVILLFHSLRSNRTLMINRAKMLWKNGYTVMLFDFQAHGESKGKNITFGYLESLDVESIYEYVKLNYPNNKVGALGISLGGAAILLRKDNKPFDAIVLEAVYPTVEEATCDRIQIRLGILAPVLTPILLSQLKMQINISKNDLKPINYIGNQNCPIFVIAGKHDKHTKISESKRLFSKAKEPKLFWEIADAEHEDFFKKQPIAYETKVLDYFDKYLCKTKDLGNY